MADVTEFPVDDVTLDILISACAVDHEDGQSHLFAVLDFGGVHYSPHQVITTLAEEVKRIRHDDEVDDESFHKGYALGYEHGKRDHLKQAEHATSKDAQVVAFEEDETDEPD